jgi:hypothetical protein
MSGDRSRSAAHFLAGAHLELVLAQDYAQCGLDEMALRSRISSASCFWRAGNVAAARVAFQGLIREFPDQAESLQRIIAELEIDYPEQ